ncbi:MAG: 50S ribosomal protein L24 [Candidatus Omnitrophica bacterium]|nr:50S ribosomal protein L24 [Candidatus Omnitrophota bacterium]
MLKIRKNDLVQVTKGKDKGKKGKVLSYNLETNRVLVEGINTVKKHKRQTRQDQKGGIVSIEMPISVANIMVLCKNCNLPARIGFTVLADKTKARFCKRCKGVI